jgi:hypothetical protein
MLALVNRVGVNGFTILEVDRKLLSSTFDYERTGLPTHPNDLDYLADREVLYFTVKSQYLILFSTGINAAGKSKVISPTRRNRPPTKPLQIHYRYKPPVYHTVP